MVSPAPYCYRFTVHGYISWNPKHEIKLRKFVFRLRKELIVSKYFSCQFQPSVYIRHLGVAKVIVLVMFISGMCTWRCARWRLDWPCTCMTCTGHVKYTCVSGDFGKPAKAGLLQCTADHGIRVAARNRQAWLKSLSYLKRLSLRSCRRSIHVHISYDSLRPREIQLPDAPTCLVIARVNNMTMTGHAIPSLSLSSCFITSHTVPGRPAVTSVAHLNIRFA